MVTLAAFTPRIVTLGRSLLLALATQDRRIQIQEKPLQQRYNRSGRPTPQRPPERFDLRLGEAAEEIALRVVARETRDPEQRVQSAIAAQPVGVGETAGAGDHGEDKRREGVGQRDR